MKRPLVLTICAAALVGILALATQGMAQVKQGKTRPLSTKTLMSGLLKPQCTALNAALAGAGPADDAAWNAAISNAELLSETGYLLMDDGRCPDGVWAGATKAIRDGSAAVLAKLKARDVAGAREAIGMINGSCKSCHTAHKK